MKEKLSYPPDDFVSPHSRGTHGVYRTTRERVWGGERGRVCWVIALGLESCMKKLSNSSLRETPTEAPSLKACVNSDEACVSLLC